MRKSLLKASALTLLGLSTIAALPVAAKAAEPASRETISAERRLFQTQAAATPRQERLSSDYIVQSEEQTANISFADQLFELSPYALVSAPRYYSRSRGGRSYYRPYSYNYNNRYRSNYYSGYRGGYGGYNSGFSFSIGTRPYTTGYRYGGYYPRYYSNPSYGGYYW